MRRLAAVLLLVLALAEPATARGNSPLVMPTGYPGGGEKQNPVEQQSDSPWLPGPLDCSADVDCVVNPLPCAWDVDDHWQFIEVDRVLAGLTTASGAVCQVMDADPQYRTVCGITGIGCLTAWWSNNRARLGVHLIAPSPDLVVTVAFVQQGRTFTLAPIPDGRQFSYEFCGHAVYDPGDPALGPIPGSAGGPYNADGIGLRTDIALSVTNPGRHAVRDITLDAQEVGAGAGGASCLVNPTYEQQQHEYPFEWTQSEP